MANPTLNWRYVGARTFVSGIDASHDAVYTLGTSATYADGSARVPGTGSAWTWNREVSGVTVSAYGTPPTNALSFSYIVAGTVAAGAYTVLLPDSGTVGNLVVVGMNRNSGAYTTWTSATPFTSASSFSGYWRGTRVFSAVAYDSVAMWESQEGCVLQYGNAASGSTSTIAFGALIDPLSTASTNAESDGRLYMMWCSGGSTVTASNWAGSVADGSAWGQGVNTTSLLHSGVFAPGTNVMIGGAGQQTARFGTFSPTTTFTSTNGDIARVPISVTSNVTGNFLGQSRQWYITKDSTSRLTWQNGGTVIGYIWAPSLTASGDAVVLTY